ncbi:MAG: MgtC/SapB family protein [Clostridium sp.]
MDEFLIYIREFNFLSIIIRLIFAVIIGGAIGFDRSRKRRAAGLKTHILVCVSSTLIMLLSIYINENFGGSGDVARLGAQVISGIGFLGAGTIIVTGNNKIKGLTTAANLWACACIGLAIGIGFYEGAIIASVIIIMIFVFLKNSNDFFDRNSRIIELCIEVDGPRVVSLVVQNIKDNGGKILNFEMSGTIITKDGIAILATVEINRTGTHEEFLNELNSIEGVRIVEEI